MRKNNIARSTVGINWRQCMFCRTERGVNESHICARCEEKLRVAAEHFARGVLVLCAYEYRAPIPKLIQAYKYNGRVHISKGMAGAIAKVYRRSGLCADMAVHVPLHENRRKKRGYDQSELIAAKFSAMTGIEHIAALKRIRDTPTQTHLNERERIENMRDAFAAVSDVAGKTVVVIDDVCTTGATVCACADALFAAGATRVYALCFAGSAK